MTAHLDRITAVLREHQFDGYAFECKCQRDLPQNEVECMDWEEHAAHAAEKVAEALGLTEERRELLGEDWHRLVGRWEPAQGGEK